MEKKIVIKTDFLLWKELEKEINKSAMMTMKSSDTNREMLQIHETTKVNSYSR